MNKIQLLIIYGIVTLMLVGVCFMPWAFYPDIKETFTGFYSYQNDYGKPGKLLILLTLINGVLLCISRLWARLTSLSLMTIFLAYGIRNYFLFTGCNNGFCPEIRIGLYLMEILMFTIFILSLFGKVKVNK